MGGVTETYTNDDADKLTTIKIGGTTVKSFGYDTAGRTTSVVTGAGTTTVAYDYEGRISTITYPSTATNTFAYNGLDTRVSKVDSAGTATYKRDGAHVTAPVIGDGSAVYTPGISERRSSTTKFYGSDRLGTNSVETNTSQAVTATKSYDAFGMPVASTGSSASPFSFAGQHGYLEDTDSGLKLLGHRYYDASTGRFLTRDPIKDGRNWYGYCENDPTSGIDPKGNNTILLNAALLNPGGRAGESATENVGQGPNDCKMWLNKVYADIYPMPPNPKPGGGWNRANDYDNWFYDHPLSWTDVPNDGDLRPGDVIVKDRLPKTGHVQIIGADGDVYDASVPFDGYPNGHPGKNQGPPPKKGIPEKSNENVSIWRPGTRWPLPLQHGQKYR